MIELNEIVMALDRLGQEQCSYYDRQADRIVERYSEGGLFGDEDPLDEDLDDDADDLSDWEKKQRELNRLIDAEEEADDEESDGPLRFVALPDQFQIDEWRMMEAYSADLDNDAHADELLRAIHGWGAFRYFKDTLHRLGIVEDWYAFRNERYREIARDFCEAHDIAFKECPPPAQ